MSYAVNRATELGLTPGQNSIQVYMPGDAEPTEQQLLSADGSRGDNMLILYLETYKRSGEYVAMSHNTLKEDSYTGRTKEIKVAYYNQRIQNPKPGQPKYKNPTGVAAQPFLSPVLIDAIAERREIETLILVEGALKALSGCLNKVYAVGINGIWGFREANSNTLHPLAQQIISTCHVKNLVFLHDGDCRQISDKPTADLMTRPLNFGKTVLSFSKAVKTFRLANPQHKGLNYYYAHLKDEGPKGLDDLFINSRDKADEIAFELNCPQLVIASGNQKYFNIFDLISELRTIASIKEYFYIDSAERFFEHHSDKLDSDPFQFGGDWYRLNEETDKLECYQSGVTAPYVLVGNKYLKEIYISNSKGFPELVREQRAPSIIIDDFKRKGQKDPNGLMLQIPVFDSYSNEPDFINYKREIVVKEHYKHLNLSYPLEHEPAEGEWPYTHEFLSHIFHNGGDSKLDVGLDMIQMYYTKPKQKQRILSLVSKERETGKSTFTNWLRDIFGQNMSIVGNADFLSQFNGYVTKCLVAVDESKVDNQLAIEAIKSMVTNPYAMLNEKNSSARQVVNHVKLVMTTNHIFDFADIDSKENRWFVLEVGKLAKKDNELLDRLKEEIPAFLHYLKNRELVHYSRESRFGISDEVVITKALKRVQANSVSQLVAMMRDYVRQYFIDHEKPVLRIDARRLYEALFPERNSKFSGYDVEKSLKNDFNLQPSHKSQWFSMPTITFSEEQVDEETGEVIIESKRTVTWEGKTGKVYEFKREDWEDQI
ncbi:MAG: primase-helicase family protein [Bacteroidota bacterium]